MRRTLTVFAIAAVIILLLGTYKAEGGWAVQGLLGMAAYILAEFIYVIFTGGTNDND